jgi:antitoxin component of MazEF toxin-antitoxin module
LPVGNSLAVRLPAALARRIGVDEGDKLSAEVAVGGRLILAREGRNVDAAAIKSLRKFLACQTETAPVVAKVRARARY